MYKVSKRMEIAGAHQLVLPYKSKCSKLHGHNWIVTVHCASKELTDYGMIVDFTKVKGVIQGRLDHSVINEVIPCKNPTAENMAKWIQEEVCKVMEVGFCYMVEVQESEGNVATYIVDKWEELL